MKKNMCGILVGAGIALVPLAVYADDNGGGGPFPHCLSQFWVNKSCSGSCPTLYTICPGKVMCLFTASGDTSASPFSPTSVACWDYTGGTGTCNVTTLCTGGTFFGMSTTSVTVQVQTCPNHNCP